MQAEIQSLFAAYSDSENRIDKADELFQVLVAKAGQSDDPAEFHNISGVMFYERDYLKQAAVQFEQALAYKPDNRQYLEHLAISYYQLQLYEQAVECFSKLRKLDPADTNTLKNLAMTYLELGQYDNAAFFLEERLLSDAKNDRDAWKAYLFALHALNLSNIIVDLADSFDLENFMDGDIWLTLFYAHYNCGLSEQALKYGKTVLRQGLDVDISQEMKEMENEHNV